MVNKPAGNEASESAIADFLKNTIDFTGALKSLLPLLAAKFREIRDAPEEIKELRRPLDTSFPEHFRYVDQFTAKRRNYPLSPSHFFIFDRSRAPKADMYWHHAEITARRVLSEWFKLDDLARDEGLSAIEREWGELFDDEVHFWKGKRGLVNVEGHPYIKQMYPFIIVGRVDPKKLSPQSDPRMYIVLLFCEWVRKLCRPGMKSEFTVNKLTIMDNYVHFDGEFCIMDVKVTSSDRDFGTPRSKYKLNRQMIIAYSGPMIYTVTTGVPHPTEADSEYTAHVHEWLSDFQLSLDRFPALRGDSAR